MNRLLTYSIWAAAALAAASYVLVNGIFAGSDAVSAATDALFSSDQNHADRELARVHRGIVDEATLSRMADRMSWSESGDVQQARVSSAVLRDDRQAILRYLVDIRPGGEIAGPKRS